MIQMVGILSVSLVYVLPVPVRAPPLNALHSASMITVSTCAVLIIASERAVIKILWGAGGVGLLAPPPHSPRPRDSYSYM